MGDGRPTVDQYFMEMTQLVKSRGTCPRRQVGAVIVKDKHVLTTGYNGAPKGFPHPTETGCIRDELGIPRGALADVCPCLHAEQNALLQAALFGVSVKDADLYCTTQPCTQCSRMIANAGIRRVVFQDEYPDPLAIGLLTTAGVDLLQYDPAAGAAVPYAKTNTWEQAQEQLRRDWREGKITIGSRPLPAAATPYTPGAPAASLTPDVSGGRVAGGAARAVPATATEADAPTADAPAAGGPAPAEPVTPEMAGVRDLSADPRREDLLRRLARERVERDRKKNVGG